MPTGILLGTLTHREEGPLLTYVEEPRPLHGSVKLPEEEVSVEHLRLRNVTVLCQKHIPEARTQSRARMCGTLPPRALEVLQLGFNILSILVKANSNALT